MADSVETRDPLRGSRKAATSRDYVIDKTREELSVTWKFKLFLVLQTIFTLAELILVGFKPHGVTF